MSDGITYSNNEYKTLLFLKEFSFQRARYKGHGGQGWKIVAIAKEQLRNVKLKFIIRGLEEGIEKHACMTFQLFKVCC